MVTQEVTVNLQAQQIVRLKCRKLSESGAVSGSAGTRCMLLLRKQAFMLNSCTIRTAFKKVYLAQKPW